VESGPSNGKPQIPRLSLPGSSARRSTHYDMHATASPPTSLFNRRLTSPAASPSASSPGRRTCQFLMSERQGRLPRRSTPVPAFGRDPPREMRTLNSASRHSTIPGALPTSNKIIRWCPPLTPHRGIKVIPPATRMMPPFCAPSSAAPVQVERVRGVREHPRKTVRRRAVDLPVVGSIVLFTST